MTALGFYDVEINGRRVGDDVLTPGWTSYHRRLRYQAFDVTDLVRPGANAIGVTVTARLGEGAWRAWCLDTAVPSSLGESRSLPEADCRSPPRELARRDGARSGPVRVTCTTAVLRRHPCTARLVERRVRRLRVGGVPG